VDSDNTPTDLTDNIGLSLKGRKGSLMALEQAGTCEKMGELRIEVMSRMMTMRWLCVEMWK
jgi:hypothetical protein